MENDAGEKSSLRTKRPSIAKRWMDHKEGKMANKAAYIKDTESLPRRLAWTDPKKYPDRQRARSLNS